MEKEGEGGLEQVSCVGGGCWFFFFLLNPYVPEGEREFDCIS